MTENVAMFKQDPASITVHPISMTFSPIRRVVIRQNIKSVGLPPENISSSLLPVKDHRGMKTLGMYNIPCVIRSTLDRLVIPLRTG
jgi:hypothetical protein